MRRLSILLLLASIHCSGQEPASELAAGPATAAIPSTPALDPGQEPTPAQAAAVPAAVQVLPQQAQDTIPDPGSAADPTSPHAVVDPNAAGLAEVRETGEAIEAALNAAAEAGGDTTCERGYNNLVAMVRELRDRVGTSGQRNPPDRVPFLEACNDLPPEVQECLVLSYALGHREECEVRKNSLDPAVRVRIRELMSGQGAQAN